MLIELSHEQIKALLESVCGSRCEILNNAVDVLEIADAELTELAEIDLDDCGDACKL